MKNIFQTFIITNFTLLSILAGTNAVNAMKYQNRRIYGQTFGKEMAEHFLSYLWERKLTLIVPSGNPP